jgi:pimeloyl-ACP methyl ester carboxylesterase
VGELRTARRFAYRPDVRRDRLQPLVHSIKEIQLDLFLDYASNVALYPAFQAFFREFKPPTLAIWGEHDPFFIPPGALAYKRDNPDAVVELLNAGHFALETHVEEIASRIDSFLWEAYGADSQ